PLTLITPPPRRPPQPTLFPYTTLFRSRQRYAEAARCRRPRALAHGIDPIRGNLGRDHRRRRHEWIGAFDLSVRGAERASRSVGLDRKSTRLNSSHVKISYAVFCLKKKK